MGLIGVYEVRGVFFTINAPCGLGMTNLYDGWTRCTRHTKALYNRRWYATNNVLFLFVCIYPTTNEGLGLALIPKLQP